MFSLNLELMNSTHLPKIESLCSKVSFTSVKSLSCVRLFATHGLQHARLPCPSSTPRTYSNLCVICISEVINISPSRLDSSLCFIQPGISHDVLAYKLNKHSKVSLEWFNINNLLRYCLWIIVIQVESKKVILLSANAYFARYDWTYPIDICYRCWA